MQGPGSLRKLRNFNLNLFKISQQLLLKHTFGSMRTLVGKPHREIDEI